MKAVLKRCLAVALAASCALAPPPAGAKTAPAYAKIRKTLRSSSVAVLLPDPIPRSAGPVRSIAVISAGKAGYYVGFSAVSGCAGALSCAFLHIAGFPARPKSDRSTPRDRPIRLPDGKRGLFRPEDCAGASCTEATLTFARPGAVYEIDVKAGADDLPVLKEVYRRLRALT